MWDAFLILTGLKNNRVPDDLVRTSSQTTGPISGHSNDPIVKKGNRSPTLHDDEDVAMQEPAVDESRPATASDNAK